MVGSSTEMFTHSGADISNSATIQHCHRCHVLQEPWSQIVSLQVSNLDDFFRRHWLDKVRQGTPERQVLTLVSSRVVLHHVFFASLGECCR